MLVKAVKYASLSYYLPIAWGRIIGFIYLPYYVKCKQPHLGFELGFTVSISYNDNHYTTSTSKLIIDHRTFNKKFIAAAIYTREKAISLFRLSSTFLDVSWNNGPQLNGIGIWRISRQVHNSVAFAVKPLLTDLSIVNDYIILPEFFPLFLP